MTARQDALSRLYAAARAEGLDPFDVIAMLEDNDHRMSAALRDAAIEVLGTDTPTAEDLDRLHDDLTEGDF